MAKIAFNWDKVKEQMAVEVEKKSGKKTYEKDTRFWVPKLDPVLFEKGSYEAIIRFLPPKDYDLPYVKIWEHAFEGPSGWYMNSCPSTISAERDRCPVCMDQTKLWSTDEAMAKIRKRKMHYVSNILVIKDPNNPETEGKVFLFKYKAQIFDKIERAIAPKVDPDSLDDVVPVPCMIWDPYEGGNFFFKVTVKDKYPWYAESKFRSASPIGTDEYVQEIHSKEYSLAPFLDPSQFKSFDELNVRYQKIMTIPGEVPPVQEKVYPFEKPPTESQPEKKAEPKVEPEKKAEVKVEQPKDPVVEKKAEPVVVPAEVALKESLISSDDDFFAKLDS